MPQTEGVSLPCDHFSSHSREEEGDIFRREASQCPSTTPEAQPCPRPGLPAFVRDEAWAGRGAPVARNA